MKTKFDIQRFAEEEEVTALTEEEQTTETVEEEQESIPEELAGLDESYARDAMKEWKELQAQSQPQEESEPPIETPTQPQPQLTDETTTLRNEITQLKAQLAQMAQSQVQAQPPRQPPTPQPQPPQQQQPELTPEMVKRLNAAIEAEAYRMSGLTKDDIASFEFADSDDERITQWNIAKAAAQNRVIGAVQQAQAQYRAQQQRIMQQQQESQRQYDEFARREMSETNFQAVFAYATNDYYNQLPQMDQMVIGDAYYRVQNGISSPAGETENKIKKIYTRQIICAIMTMAPKMAGGRYLAPEMG